MKDTHVFISGFVQGVGFRHFVKGKATELGLAGWVKNLPDNRVEALFQGKEQTIEKMIEICKKGPFLSEVNNVTINREEPKIIYRGFDIV